MTAQAILSAKATPDLFEQRKVGDGWAADYQYGAQIGMRDRRWTSYPIVAANAVQSPKSLNVELLQIG
jgi:hypothetical protein